jgi:hypothetical protein
MDCDGDHAGALVDLRYASPRIPPPRRRLRPMVARHGSGVTVKVAHNPQCGPTLLHELANLVPPVQKAYRTIAAHPCAMAPTLLLGLRDTQVRSVAARHPALPVATIVELLDDADERVAESAAANASLPRPVMERLLRTGPWTRHRPPATSHPPPATSRRPPATGHRPPATGHRPPIVSADRSGAVRRWPRPGRCR